MVDVHSAAHLADIGMEFVVIKPDGKAEAKVVEKPFFDPKKKLAASELNNTRITLTRAKKGSQ
jgi:hypothetical protein